MHILMEQEFGIDGSFIIHLKTKHERSHIIDDLRSMGFENIQNYDAVVGKNLEPSFNYISPRVMLELTDGRTSNEGITSMGAIGCYISHTNLWKELVENGTSPESSYIIFEDDVDTKNMELSKKKLMELKNQILQKDFDVIFLGIYPRCNKNLPVVNERYIGNHAYIITKKGAEKLLKYAFPIDMHLDAYIGVLAKKEPDIKIYGYQIFSQQGGLGKSDTGIGEWLGWASSGDCYPRETFKYNSTGKTYIWAFLVTAVLFLALVIYMSIKGKK